MSFQDKVMLLGELKAAERRLGIWRGAIENESMKRAAETEYLILIARFGVASGEG